MCRLDIRLAPGDRSVVLGYGMPFSHPGEQFEAFINNNAPDSVGVTLIEVLQRREFSFIVASPSNALRSWWTQPLPPPLRYPYGQEHSWSYERYCDLISENKGPQFPTAWSFDNDNDHLTALTQSEIQDVMWVHQEAMKIGEIFFRAYFIAPAGVHPQNCREFYAIVTLGEPFLERYRQPWSRLVNSGSLQLLLFDHNSDMGPAEWNARVAEGFSMAGHPVSNEDLVLQVQRPRPTDIDRRPDFEVTAFDSRWRADNAKELDEDSWTRVLLQFDEDMLRDHERKVKAVNWFSSQSKPFNAVDGEVATPPISEDLRFKMALHRALVHGNGFWKVLGPNQDGEEMDQLSGAMARARLTRPAGLMPRRSLPVVNLIDLPDEHIDALMEEVLRDDNMRLYNYLAERCLGLVLVAAVSDLPFLFLDSTYVLYLCYLISFTDCKTYLATWFRQDDSSGSNYARHGSNSGQDIRRSTDQRCDRQLCRAIGPHFAERRQTSEPGQAAQRQDTGSTHLRHARL